MYLADRVKDTSTTTGTGTVTVSGTAASTFLTWAQGYAVGDLVSYCIAHQAANEWETGKGVLLTATTISRSAQDVENGSGGVGVLVNFAAGTKDVFSPATAQMCKSAGQMHMASLRNTQ